MKNSKDKRIRDVLKSFDIYKYCTKEWHELITKNIRKKTVLKGQRLFNEGDTADGIYILKSGKAKIVTRYDEVNERIVRVAKEGDFIGFRSLASEKFHISVVALTDISVEFMSKDFFYLLLKSNPELSIYMIDFISKELKDSEKRMSDFIHQDVKKRIADIICMLIDAYGFDSKSKNKLAFTLSRSDFANMAGTAYETVLRTFDFFQEKGFIKLSGKSIFVVNEKALRAIEAKNY